MSKTRFDNQNLQGSPADGTVALDSGAEIVLLEAGEMEDHGSSIGMRLKQEREKRGWSCDEVASRLKLQAGLIRRIEQDDYNGIAHAVYLRGYLSSYARLLGLPVILAERACAEKSEPAPLVSTGTISRSRYMLDRYSVSATYLILTGLVIGPAVWLATHGGLEQNLARSVMLDGPATTIERTAPDARVSTNESVVPGRQRDLEMDKPIGIDAIASSTMPSPSDAPDVPPIVASMAPFVATQPSIPPAPAPVVQSDQHKLTLKLSQASWVEITDSMGGKLEYGLLVAGTERQYSSAGTMSVRIGNAQGAEIIADGKSVDLAPFRRANVAHLKVFAEGGLATGADS